LHRNKTRVTYIPIVVNGKQNAIWAFFQNKQQILVFKIVTKLPVSKEVKIPTFSTSDE
jgi:hypothetical protein